MQVKNEARKNTERDIAITLNDAKRNIIDDTKTQERNAAYLDFQKAIQKVQYNVCISLLSLYSHAYQHLICKLS